MLKKARKINNMNYQQNKIPSNQLEKEMNKNK